MGYEWINNIWIDTNNHLESLKHSKRNLQETIVFPFIIRGCLRFLSVVPHMEHVCKICNRFMLYVLMSYMMSFAALGKRRCLRILLVQNISTPKLPFQWDNWWNWRFPISRHTVRNLYLELLGGIQREPWTFQPTLSGWATYSTICESTRVNHTT